METLADYLAQAKAPQRRVRMAEVLEWAERTFSGLELRVAWNQPVFTDPVSYTHLTLPTN